MDSPTGIDLQGEAKAFLKSNNQWYPIDYATATFGQGVAVSPIQMLTAFSSLINGGELILGIVFSIMGFWLIRYGFVPAPLKGTSWTLIVAGGLIILSSIGKMIKEWLILLQRSMSMMSP